jgi:hypothetical protein
MCISRAEGSNPCCSFERPWLPPALKMIFCTIRQYRDTCHPAWIKYFDIQRSKLLAQVSEASRRPHVISLD